MLSKMYRNNPNFEHEKVVIFVTDCVVPIEDPGSNLGYAIYPPYNIHTVNTKNIP